MTGTSGRTVRHDPPEGRIKACFALTQVDAQRPFRAASRPKTIRAPDDKLWEQHMRDGDATIYDSGVFRQRFTRPRRDRRYQDRHTLPCFERSNTAIGDVAEAWVDIADT